MLRGIRHIIRRSAPRLGAGGVMRLLPIALIVMAVSCAIEPPLKLAGRGYVEVIVPEVITDIEVIWELDHDWNRDWWYGWDQEDIAKWGTIEYPEPTSFEARLYYLGSMPSAPHLSLDKLTLYEKSFRRSFDFGYHNMLFWSNVGDGNGVQSLIFNEDDPTDIHATTSRSRVNYNTAYARGMDLYHHPEIFYAGGLNNFMVSSDTLDYDYYDAERHVWVKKANAQLTPLVYTYLVQLVIYNNNGKVLSLGDDATITSLAKSVNIHTGHTSQEDINVTFPMRMKKDIPARQGRHADIIGGKLTTFGLCDMQPWAKSRGSRYTGGRADLDNHLLADLAFYNGTDSAYAFYITPQMQAQAHGGVITIEIDADTLVIPSSGHGQSSSGFDPHVVPRDSVENEFEM